MALFNIFLFTNFVYKLAEKEQALSALVVDVP
jgi:hypothetical protein